MLIRHRSLVLHIFIKLLKSGFLTFQTVVPIKEKILRAKGIPIFFVCGRLFFILDALKTVKRPLKTVQILKKGTQNFFACGGRFFKKDPRSNMFDPSPLLDRVWFVFRVHRENLYTPIVLELHKYYRDVKYSDGTVR